MNEILLTALAKAAANLADGMKLPTGTHKVDAYLTCRLTGEISKAADTDKKSTTKILTKQTIALILRYAGVTREAAKGILTRAFTEAMAADEKADLGDYAEGMAEAMKHVNQIVAKLPRIPVAGAVRADLQLTVVENVQGIAASNENAA